MKQLVTIIFFLSFWTQTFAKCGSNGIHCLTTSTSINKNGLIILEFYATSQELIKDLNKKYPIYLKSTKAKITLDVIEIFKGQYGLTQVVLKPKFELILNQEYSLQIDKLPKTETKPSLTFTVASNIDNLPPVLTAQPTEIKKTFVSYGCGPAEWIYFKFSSLQDKDCFVRTTVKNKKTGLQTTFILKQEEGILKIGHSMCSGAFSFFEGDKFEATFQLIDQAGNKSVETKTITFTKPTKETDGE